MMRFRKTEIVASLVSIAATVASIPFQGVNLAGLEFYTVNNDRAVQGYVTPYAATEEGFPTVRKLLFNQNQSFTSQIDHFASLGFNVFRIPFSWQRLQPSLKAQGDFDLVYYQYIKDAVSNATVRNATTILDVHNYARVDLGDGSINGIIGEEDGPTVADFAALWKKLSADWKTQPLVWFGIMNEPHDLNVDTWSKTVQSVIDSIRGEGALNTILIPGSSYSGTDNWSQYSSDLLKLQNPDKSTDGLVFDLHHYWDGRGGATGECNASLPSLALSDATEILEQNNRSAFLSETGFGNGSLCQTYMGDLFDFLSNKSDAWLGYTLWGAGEFFPDDKDGVNPLTISPNRNGSDQPQIELISQSGLLPASGDVREPNAHQTSQASTSVSPGSTASAQASSSVVSTTTSSSASSSASSGTGSRTELAGNGRVDPRVLAVVFLCTVSLILGSFT